MTQEFHGSFTKIKLRQREMTSDERTRVRFLSGYDNKQLLKSNKVRILKIRDNHNKGYVVLSNGDKVKVSV